MNQQIDDPVSFFHELGGLHDASIEYVTWDIPGQQIKLRVTDLYSNFDGLPGDPGREGASIIFMNIENLSLSCNALKNEVQRIYSLDTVEKQKACKYQLMIQISPSGYLNFDYTAVKIA